MSLAGLVDPASLSPGGGGEKEEVGQMKAKGGVLYAATVFALILPPCFLQQAFLCVCVCVLSPGYLSSSTHPLFLLLLSHSPPGLADLLCCPANCAT